MNKMFLLFEASMSSYDSRHAETAAVKKRPRNQRLIWMLNHHPGLYFQLLEIINSVISTGKFTIKAREITIAFPSAAAAQPPRPRLLRGVPDMEPLNQPSPRQKDAMNTEAFELNVECLTGSSDAFFSYFDVNKLAGLDQAGTELLTGIFLTLSSDTLANLSNCSLLSAPEFKLLSFR
ncbi:uncharacterized protein EURHEDRAFT_242490 [Aspergillus ruber CBS 135680]|uniref:Uncharacterized protein n=1 Tax=Aspergillus ruber (strain CBS 135680) TaxID=1388766 RepID=A0A017S3H9_ASPRC|nr:uncharacterized protein EURHEDRAFT_242490 [Aspergillus ruber CBS 135680]EYE91543.1 hypothetical protein EURHEDRAFT_242490 [Aspergillus ruber CBS 135680]